MIVARSPKGEEFEVLEPHDLDALGLTPNIRAPAIKAGELAVWMTLRGGKFFLFLREDVERYQLIRKRARLARAFFNSEEQTLSARQVELLRELEATIETPEAPPVKRTRARRSQS